MRPTGTYLERGADLSTPHFLCGVPLHKSKQLAGRNSPTLVLPFPSIVVSWQLPRFQFLLSDTSSDRIRRETDNGRRFLHQVLLLKGVHGYSPFWIPLPSREVNEKCSPIISRSDRPAIPLPFRVEVAVSYAHLISAKSHYHLSIGSCS